MIVALSLLVVVVLAALVVFRRRRTTTAKKGEAKDAAPPGSAAEGRSISRFTTGQEISLCGTAGPLTGDLFPLRPGELGIGRDPAVCAIVLPPDTQGVSRHHLIVQAMPDGHVRVMDNGSRGGTTIGGQPLPAGEWVPLLPGADLVLGTSGVRFTLQKESRAAGP